MKTKKMLRHDQQIKRTAARCQQVEDQLADLRQRLVQIERRGKV